MGCTISLSEGKYNTRCRLLVTKRNFYTNIISRSPGYFNLKLYAHRLLQGLRPGNTASVCWNGADPRKLSGRYFLMRKQQCFPAGANPYGNTLMPRSGAKASSVHFARIPYFCRIEPDMLPALNFPAYPVRTRQAESRLQVYDSVRRRYVRLTPEEWVRQHLLFWLMQEYRVPMSRIGVEKSLKVNGLPRRFDVVVFNRNGSPLLLAECKAPGVVITEKAFDQAARYNLALKATYFMVTNGLDHFICRLEPDSGRYVFLAQLPQIFQEG